MMAWDQRADKELDKTRVQLNKTWMGGFKRAYLKLEPVALGNIHVYIELR
jgi:hypothetical protein